jgi:hypothetical protein
MTPVKTSDRGVVTIDKVMPGPYSIQAKLRGFNLGLVRDPAGVDSRHHRRDPVHVPARHA